MATVRARSATWGTAACALVLLAGCGQQSGSASDDASASSSTSDSATASSAPAVDLSGKPWLLRYESYSGEDGETKTAIYVTLTPSTGAVSKVSLPANPVSESTADGRLLLVDASHQWAINDVQPSKAERKAGTITLHDLANGGAASTLDVRALTGDATTKTAWASFDPTTPGILRVVSGQKVWKVDVNAKSATADDPLPTAPSDEWIYSGGFDKNTGLPYIESIDSNDTLPAGNGADDTRPVERDGGTVLTFDGATAKFGDLPDPGCEVAIGYVTKVKGAYAFCVDNTSVSVKSIDAGGSSWKDVGSAVADAAPADGDPVFALPPATA